MNNIRIVPMTADHLDALEQLERTCFSRPWSRKMLAEELDNQCAAFLGEQGTQRLRHQRNFACHTIIQINPRAEQRQTGKAADDDRIHKDFKNAIERLLDRFPLRRGGMGHGRSTQTGLIGENPPFHPPADDQEHGAHSTACHTIGCKSPHKNVVKYCGQAGGIVKNDRQAR